MTSTAATMVQEIGPIVGLESGPEPSRTDAQYWDEHVRRQSQLQSQHDSCTELVADENLQERIVTLFRNATDDIFEDGIENEFSTGLLTLMTDRGEDVVDCIVPLLSSGHVNEEIAVETIRCVARLEHQTSATRRLWLLEYCLSNNSARIRDAAAMGLASLDEPHAIPYLHQAIRSECQPELRSDLEEVLRQLQRSVQ